MFMKPRYRKTKNGGGYYYYILCESRRDSWGLPTRYELMNVGRHDDFTTKEMDEVADLVTAKSKGEPESVFHEQEHSGKVRTMAECIYSQLIAQKKIDLPGVKPSCESELEARRREHERRFIADSSTIKHPWSLQIGAEHLCVETMKKLRLGEALGSLGFTVEQTALALTQIAIRAIHPASELATSLWIKPHSDICRLTGYDVDRITKDRLYASAIHLYDVSEGLMKHLSRWTKELFGYDDNLILYDLTNVYAEGDYDGSKMWDYGHSKEKRDDCKLLVLALVVNRHGFPKHYQLFEGRMQDYDSFQAIIDELDAHMKSLGVNPIVVMDAGISTAENLDLLREREYKFLCVSRSSRRAYKPIEGEPVQHMEDRLHQPLEIQRVEVEFRKDKDGKLPTAAADTFYWVRSEAKAAKENGMYDQFTRRFEAELEKISASLAKKHGTKSTDKVLIRIGRAKQKFPSVASHYDIDITEDKEKGTVTAITWKLKDGYDHNKTAGVYFLQTSLDGKDGLTVWTIYNILKEVESSFRCMKSDLNLRPVFHKNDKSCLAHLHLGILAYWVVATIRYQLKQKGYTKGWTQIVEIMDTQHSVASEMKNLDGDTIHIEQPTEPTEQVCQICEKVGIPTMP
ncbi:MAG: IS1634 family transposase, partial [Prevotella sp.]|nr:IS1634 family transposase [Prevotella sp.]